jgi:hypothetical protein
MAASVAGFAAAIAVAVVTTSVSFVHLLAMVLAYLSATLFVSYLVSSSDPER